MKKKKILIGRQEWCALPELNIDHIRAKMDTGAKTSALHVSQIECFKNKHTDFVRFVVQPYSDDKDITHTCEAKVLDQRTIVSSNGEKEERFVILTSLQISEIKKEIEVTLANRTLMRFNLLLGRQALKQFALIDPSKSYLLGRLI